MDDVKAKIDQRNERLTPRWPRTTRSGLRQAWPTRYAQWTVENARLAVLEAMDARAFAVEPARAAGNAQ